MQETTKTNYPQIKSYELCFISTTSYLCCLMKEFDKDVFSRAFLETIDCEITTGAIEMPKTASPKSFLKEILKYKEKGYDFFETINKFGATKFMQDLNTMRATNKVINK